MPEGGRQVRVFVSSPIDARFERRRLERVIERLNGEFQGIARLVAIRWETEFYRAHTTFQAQIPEAAQCDIVIAIFRARLGTEMPADFPRMDNGESYPSGTAYEVLTAIGAAKDRGFPDVYVFRYPQPPSVQLDDPRSADIEAQWTRLKAFFEAWFRSQTGQFKAAFQTFASTDDFEAQAEALLRKWLDRKVLHGRTVVWPIEIKGSPFRGLAAFGVKHASVFFGRSRDIANSVERFKDAAERGCPFLLVDGASGTGKSSLVRAGLVPRLTAAGVVPAVDLWRVVAMRPGELSGDPFAALARALLARNEDLPEYERGRPPALPELSASDFPSLETLAAQLAHADASALRPILGTLDALALAEQASGGYDRPIHSALLLVVDQLDELFSLAVDLQPRFAALLDHLARSKRVWIAATLRADLFVRLLAEPALKQLKEDGTSYDLAAPAAADLPEIVRGPAAAAGLRYETDPASGEMLDELLLKDAERPDLLPLLQFTLNQLFEAARQSADPGLLTFAAYRALGGLEGAVDKEAEAAIEALGGVERARLPRLLRELASPSREDSVTAAGAAFEIRPVPLAVAAYDEPSARLVRALVDARILLSSGEGQTATLRLAHARVLDAWRRAKLIVAENADFYRIRSDVEEQRRKWQAARRAGDLLIGRGRPLAEAESIVRRFPEEIPVATREFIRRSGRRARLAQTLTGAAAVLFALVAGGAFYARQEAVRSQSLALQRLTDSLISQSRYLAGVAFARGSAGDPVKAIAIALEAMPSDMAKPDRPYVPEAEFVLRSAYRYARWNKFSADWKATFRETINAASLSPDGTTIATAAGESIRLYRKATHSDESLPGLGDRVWFLHFLPDGRLVVATREAVGIYDLAARKYAVELKAPGGNSVCGWDFNSGHAPDQPEFRIYSVEGEVTFDRLRWSMKFANPVRRVATATAHCIPAGIDAATILDGFESFSQIDRADSMVTNLTSVLAIMNRSSQLWIEANAAAGRIVPTGNGEQFISAIASPDGRQVVAATKDGKVVLLNAESLQRIYQSSASGRPILSLDLSADSQQLMIAHETGDVEVLSRDSSNEISRIAGMPDPAAGNLSICTRKEPARIVASADGSRRIRLSEGTARLVSNASAGSAEGVAIGEANATVLDAVFSIDGRRAIVVAEPRDVPGAKTRLIYDADTGALLDRKQVMFGTADRCVRFSADQRHAALVRSDGGGMLVDFETGSIVRDYPSGTPVLGVTFSNSGDRMVSYGVDGSLIMTDAANGIAVDRYAVPALAGGGPMPFGFDRSGRQVMIVRRDQSYAWSVLQTSELIAAAMAYVPLCIAPGERASFYLSPEPPDWCIERGNFPYNTEAWKTWLDAKRAGHKPPMPAT